MGVGVVVRLKTPTSAIASVDDSGCVAPSPSPVAAPPVVAAALLLLFFFLLLPLLLYCPSSYPLLLQPILLRRPPDYSSNLCPPKTFAI